MLKSAFRILTVSLFLAFGGTQVFAQTTTDEGLPPGWTNWATECGQTGQRDACYNEATRLYWGAGGKPVNKTKAAHFMTMACRYKDHDSCRKAIKISRDEIFNPELYGEALDAGCLVGATNFCEEGYYFYSGYGEYETFSKAVQARAYNPSLALAYANASCSRGVAFACNQVGRAFSSDPEMNLKGITFDHKVSREGFIKACRLNDMAGCYFAFNGSDGENGIPLDTSIRNEALATGCKLLKTFMCQLAARSYLDGEKSTEIDTEKGLSFTEKGCTFASKDQKRDACGEAAYYLAMHLGENHDRTDQVAYMGCQADSAAACVIKANNLRTRGKSDVSIRDTYQKACDLGHVDACDWAEEINQKFKRSGMQGALKSYQKACDLGHTPTCQWLIDRKQRLADAAQAKIDEEDERVGAEMAARAAAYKRRAVTSSCPRAACERRTWGQYLKDERDAARARNDAWHKSQSYAPSGASVLAFWNNSNTARTVANYQYVLKCGGSRKAYGC